MRWWRDVIEGTQTNEKRAATQKKKTFGEEAPNCGVNGADDGGDGGGSKTHEINFQARILFSILSTYYNRSSILGGYFLLRS